MHDSRAAGPTRRASESAGAEAAGKIGKWSGGLKRINAAARRKVAASQPILREARVSRSPGFSLPAPPRAGPGVRQPRRAQARTPGWMGAGRLPGRAPRMNKAGPCVGTGLDASAQRRGGSALRRRRGGRGGGFLHRRGQDGLDRHPGGAVRRREAVAQPLLQRPEQRGGHRGVVLVAHAIGDVAAAQRLHGGHEAVEPVEAAIATRSMSINFLPCSAMSP